jgi:deoxyribonuclease IV
VPDLTIGCHLSLGRRPRLSIQEVWRHGARCAQIFASSPGAWKPPVIQEDWCSDVRHAFEEFHIAPVVIHAIYLINLGSSNPDFVKRSRVSLRETMKWGSNIGATGVVTHIGSHGGSGFDAVAQDVSDSIVEILANTPETVDLILENSAGAGGLLGSTLEELFVLLDLAGKHPRLKVALDTAHLCGAGWDFTQEGEARRLVETIDATVGMRRVALIHANDSKVAPGSRRDRHASIGEGHLTFEGFRHLLSQPELAALPWILETPDLDVTLPKEEWMRSLPRLHEIAASICPLESAT